MDSTSLEQVADEVDALGDEPMSAELRAVLLRMLSGPAPPITTGSHRHPSSNPTEAKRKELDQCQNCLRSREPGRPLRRCAACGIEKYCSEECQQKAWPTHKAKCKLNRRIKDAPPDMADALKDLRLFTSKHRPIITESVARAFNLRLDPTRSQRDVLVIFLVPRPDSKRRETSFYCTDAQILPVEQVGRQAEELAEQVQKLRDQMKAAGRLGAVFVLLMCKFPDKIATNVSPVGFGDDIYSDDLFEFRTGFDWKGNLLKHINEGIVL